MICSKRQLYTLYICAKLLKPTDNFIRKRIRVTFLRVNEKIFFLNRAKFGLSRNRINNK